MDQYVMNKFAQHSGDHEIHNATNPCHYMPMPQNQEELGYFHHCLDAVAEAKSRYPSYRINGCFFCVKECHTG
jgi:hypothetical protein